MGEVVIPRVSVFRPAFCSSGESAPLTQPRIDPENYVSTVATVRDEKTNER